MRKHHTLDDEIERQLREHAEQYVGFELVFQEGEGKSSNELRQEIKRILGVLRAKKMPFPLTRYWFPVEQLAICYQNLKAQTPEWLVRSHDKLKGHPGTMWMPTQYKGEACQLLVQTKDWWNIDICVDYFTEYERVRCRKDYAKSLWTAWQDDEIMEAALRACKQESKVINSQTLRNGIYRVSRELALFRPSRAKHLAVKILSGEVVHELKGKRWLDISAGWGDRLLAACSLNMDYLGFDPNERLRLGHGEMLKMFGSERQRVIYQPFESSQSAKLIREDVQKNGLFDICLVSPPFFTIEKYEGEEQSVVNYPKLDDWLVNFLFRSLHIAWKNLQVGGYLAINIGDLRGCEMVEPMLLFILNHLAKASWMGMLPFSGRGTQDCPGLVYVWRKAGEDEIPVRPEGETRSLSDFSPRLARGWESLPESSP